MLTLKQLEDGQKGRVIRLDNDCQGFERFRLLDLGLVPGTEVTRAFDNPLKDPVAYLIRGATIALRKKQAEKVLIDIID